MKSTNGKRQINRNSSMVLKRESRSKYLKETDAMGRTLKNLSADANE